MRNLPWVVCALLVGCGSGSGGGGGTGGTGGGGAGGGGGGGAAGSGGGGGGGGGAQVAVTGKVVSSGGMGTGTGPQPISGATVTITGTQTSATTAADGSFSVMAAAGSTIFLTVTKSTYQSSEAGYVVPASGGAVPDTQLLLNSEVSAAVGALSPALTIDPSKAAVIVQFYDQSQTAGYGATLSAAHDNSFNPETGSYANTTAGGKNKQTLVFPNVVAGTTTVTATTPQGKTCTPQEAITNWRADAGVFTWVSFNCQ